MQTEEVKIDVRTPDGKKVRWQDATRTVGTALRVVPRFTVDAEDDQTGLAATLFVEYDEHEGRFVARRVSTRSLSGGEITGEELRRVRVAEALREASPACVAFPIDDEGTMTTAAELSSDGGRLVPEWITAPLRALEGAGAVPGGVRAQLREARMEAVQLVYGVAAFTGRPPMKAVADELGIPERTAAHWIKLAREAGMLEGMGSAVGRLPRGKHPSVPDEGR